MMITSYTTTAKTPDFRLRRKYRHIRLPQRDTLSSAVINYSDLDRITPIGGGVGGTIVYKVLHRPTNKLYALKAIHSQVEHDEILTQTRIFRDRDHPNLLKCHNVFNSRQDGTHILLEYMDAGSLENAHVHSESVLSDLALQILSGLHYLHKRKIVHRDIKPSNLLVNSRNNVKIADFGSESRRNLVSLGMITYMSPERIDAPADNISRGEYDGCAEDIWSFGVCILEFYLGISPYDHFVKEGDWASLMRAICASEPPSAPETASREFCDFIGCCLRRDPAMRWTAKELLKHPFILRYSSRWGRCGNMLTFLRKASKCFHCGLRGYEV